MESTLLTEPSTEDFPGMFFFLQYPNGDSYECEIIMKALVSTTPVL